MNKYLLGSALAIALAGLTACSVDDGKDPGSEKSPLVTIYTYTPTEADGEDINPDNDVKVRFAANSATDEVYYLVEDAAVADAAIEADPKAYMDKVVASGTKLTNANGASFDVLLTGLLGPNAITAVAVKGNKRTLTEDSFTGLTWTDVVEGAYYFQTVGGAGTVPTVVGSTLQVCDYDDSMYRLTNVLGEGKALRIYMMDLYGQDADGKYETFRVPLQETDYTYGKYGTVYVYDIGYWQGSDSFAKPGSGNESGMYVDGENKYLCFFGVTWRVSAGYLAYNFDYFIPN